MVNSRNRKKSTTKRVKKKVKITPVRRKSDRTSVATDQREAPHVMLEKTRQQLKSLGEKLSEAADKGLHDSLDGTKHQLSTLGARLQEAGHRGMQFVREIAEEVHRFATDATELTKIKIEIHNMNKERETLLQVMGEKLKNLYHANQLKNIRSKFSYDFKKLDELEASIREKQKDADTLSLDMKSIQ